jgi:hypothetical protein
MLDSVGFGGIWKACSAVDYVTCFQPDSSRVPLLLFYISRKRVNSFGFSFETTQYNTPYSMSPISESKRWSLINTMY